MNIYSSIKNLIAYGIDCGLISQRDVCYAENMIISVLNLDCMEKTVDIAEHCSLHEILSGITDYAVSKGICEDTIIHRDLFDTKVMACLMPRPSEMSDKFDALYKVSPGAATDWYYKISCDSNYIRTDRIEKDKKWTYKSPYGELDITINLSKPEKDPKAIAAEKNAPQSSYPKCMLCKETEGYEGRVNFPARQNHRIIPLTLSGEEWFMQYSPYVYYNEHCIVLNGSHTPMKIDRSTFEKLFEFVTMFPHYFIGSNADLPIVGGSILSHEHFQGGNYEFAMAKAPVDEYFVIPSFEDVEMGIVRWPMSTLRLRSTEYPRLVELSDKILCVWRNYTDEDAFVFAETNGEKHNTITPIVRQREGVYEIDLVLRNNITTTQHPLGLYHPHAELHNIKKENIGLIEVMGLAVLPGRLNSELEILSRAIVSGSDISADERIAKHKQWVKSFIGSYEILSEEQIGEILRIEVGRVFQKVLEHSGVFKCDENGRKTFVKFLEAVCRDE